MLSPVTSTAFLGPSTQASWCDCGMSAGCTRREFLKTTTAALAGSAVFSLTEAVSLSAGAPAAAGSELIPQRVLGRTGVKVSILGLGGDGLISDSTDKDAVARFLNEAMDLGVNYFDTAYVYGKDGLCESNLGLLMGTPRRKGAFVATKTGSRTYDGAMRQVETSLKRLRIDALDLIQVHHVKPGDDVKKFAAADGVLAALRKLRDQKVVRFIGLTGHPNHREVKEALEAYDWDTFMCFVNPAKFSAPALDEQLPLALKKNMGIIAMKTFGGRPGRIVGTEKGQADAASLLRFAWTQPIATAIPGVSTLQQLAENIRAARSFTPMSPAEMTALRTRIDSSPTPWMR